MTEDIFVERPDQQALAEQGVFDWPIWTKEVSEFPWTYDDREVCYVLEGEVTVIPENGEPVHIKPGDLVTFRQGLHCTWKIHKNIRKHYNFT